MIKKKKASNTIHFPHAFQQMLSLLAFLYEPLQHHYWTHDPVVEDVVLGAAMEVGVEDDVAVAHEELAELLLRHGDQVEVLHSAGTQARTVKGYHSRRGFEVQWKEWHLAVREIIYWISLYI